MLETRDRREAGRDPAPGGGPPAFLPAADTVPFDRARLSDHLRAHGFAYDPTTPLRQFAGGLANRNYLIVVNGAGMVLRRAPDGPLPPGAHDMVREHRVLSRLSGALAFAPNSLHLCGDPGVLGAPFQLLEYRPGVLVRGSDMSSVAHVADAPVRLSEMMVQTLAGIHAVDAESIGLGDLGRPTGFVERTIAGWVRRGFAALDGAPEAKLVEEIGDWLGRQRYGERAPTLLHSDFKLDNIILDPETLQPRAVVDWDMATRGDPAYDLATLLSYWSQPGDPASMVELDQMPTMAPGFWSRDEAARRYAEITGRRLDDLSPLLVLATLRLGVVFVQLHSQFARGAVKQQRYARFRMQGIGLLLHARELAWGQKP